MKVLKLLKIGILLFFLPVFMYGQTVKENQLVTINGEKIILHTVRAGETIYSISKSFKVEQTLLIQKNNGIENGINIGQVIKIPLNELVDPSELPAFTKGEPTGFTSYLIESNSETAYSVSRKFGITVDELYSYNPGLQRFKKGVKIKIPVWEAVAENKVASKPVESNAVEFVQNPKVIEHQVVSGETLYSICKKYNVTENEILSLNPEVRNLKAGSKIKIPQNPDKLNSAGNEPVAAGKQLQKHTIEPGETIFSLTREFGITEQELKNLNPVLENGLKAGMVISIPARGEGFKSETQVIEQVAKFESGVGGECIPQKNKNQRFNVAVFLPLFLDANEELNMNLNIPLVSENEELAEANQDTIIENEEPPSLMHKFYGNSENFLQFYEGMLIAIDSMKKTGMNVSVSVYDSKESPEAVRKAVNSPSFAETDLIIGPVYENVQKEVANVSSKLNIPMISPFTPKSQLVNNNPHFYQINPTREFVTEATADMVIQNYSGSNLVIIKTSSYEKTPDGQLVDLIEKKLVNNGIPKPKVYDFRTERSRGFAGIFSKEKENVVIIPSSDAGELSVAISNLNNVADTYPITLIAGSNYQQKYPSIEVAHFHNLKMQYVNPYWVDYQSNGTISYFEKFKSEFGTEPNSYGIQGFDATYFFLQALYSYGKDFSLCLPKLNLKLVQGNYSFKKVSPSGGFMNEGVSVISYNRNFEVEQKNLK